MQDLAIGSQVGEKYRIVGKLGEGGMGAVYSAQHVELGQSVAIKIVLSHVADDGVLKRFQREAIALAQLESEHVVRVFDWGTVGQRTPYLVMEMLKGMDLADYLLTRGPLSAVEVAEVGIGACEALAEAHAKGIVHRDIKPANLFLSERPFGKRSVKVLDFGIAMFREGNTEKLTAENIIVGTLHYLSPEQLSGTTEVTGQSDVWSLGAALFELATGREPFAARNAYQLVELLRKGAPLAHTVRPGVPLELSNILARCLTTDLKKRFASALELRAALKEIRRGHNSDELFIVRAPGPEELALATTDPDGSDVATTKRPDRARPTHVIGNQAPAPIAAHTLASPGTGPRGVASRVPVLALLGAGVAIALLAVVAIVGFRYMQNQPATPASPMSAQLARAAPTMTSPTVEPIPTETRVPLAIASTIAPAVAATAPRVATAHIGPRPSGVAPVHTTTVAAKPSATTIAPNER
jgi:eukaryotic-like serine/threonine-protein kinase